jgi:hypothetical protein
VRVIFLVTAHRDQRESQELWVPRVEVVSTAVRRTISPETAHKAVLASVVRAAVRLDLITAIDAVSPVISLVIAQTQPLRVLSVEVETVSDAEKSATLPEIAQMLRCPLRDQEVQDPETVSSVANQAISPEIARLKNQYVTSRARAWAVSYPVLVAAREIGI